MARIRMYNMMMQDGTQIIDLEDLRDFFDLESVLEYYKKNQLYEWLRSRGYSEQADKIKELKPESPDFEAGFYSALGVERKNDLESRSLEKIDRDFITMHSFLSEEGKTVFNTRRKQVAETSDVARALADVYDTVYLLEGTYNVKLTEKNTQYIGIGKRDSVISIIIEGSFFKNDIAALFKHCELQNKEAYDNYQTESLKQYEKELIDYLKMNLKGTSLSSDLMNKSEDLKKRGFDVAKIEENARNIVSIPTMRIKNARTQQTYKGIYRVVQKVDGFEKDDFVTLIYKNKTYKCEGKVEDIEQVAVGDKVEIEATVVFKYPNYPLDSDVAGYLVKGHNITVGNGEMVINDIMGTHDVILTGQVKEGFFHIGETVSVVYDDNSTIKAVISSINKKGIGVSLIRRIGAEASIVLKSEDSFLYSKKIIALKKESEWEEPMY